MAVATDVVDPLHRRPVFCRAQPGERIGRHLTRVRMRPIAGKLLGGMRRVLERVVAAIPDAAADLLELGVNRDHRLAEAVELRLRLALGRLDHQRIGHRERQRRGVEAVVHQTLGDVLGGDADLALQRAQVEDALVRHAPVGAGVQHAEVRREARRDVVGVQDRELGGAAQARGAQHADVHPRDRKNQRASVRRRGHRAVRAQGPVV